MYKLYTFLLIMLSLCSFGQEPYYYNFNEEVDFQSQTVYDIFEDSKSNIWFGTNEGLFRWDGLTLDQFKVKEYSYSYSNIQESKGGLIWCQNFSGQFFIVHEGVLIIYEDLIEIVNGRIDFKVDYFPEIYYFTEYGIFESNFYSKEKIIHQFRPYKNNSWIIFAGDTIYAEVVYSPTISENGFNCTVNAAPTEFDLSKKKFQTLFEERKFWPDPKICNFTYHNELILGFAHESYGKFVNRRMKEKNWNFISMDDDLKINFSSVYFDANDETLLIGHSRGLNKVEISTGLFTTLLPGYNVSKIIKDRENNFWVSTLNKGVILIPNLNLISFKLGEESHDFIAANNQLLAFSEAGKIYEFIDNKFVLLNDLKREYALGKPLYNPFTNSCSFEKSDLIYSLDKNSFHQHNFEFGSKEILNLDENTWLEVRSSSFQIASINKAYIENYDHLIPENVAIEKLVNYDKYRGIFREKRCYSVCVTNDKRTIYAAFSDGIFKFNNKGVSEIEYKSESILTTKLLSDNEEIWFSNTNNEILNLKNDVLSLVLRTDSRITSYYTNQAYLFVGTTNGVVRYDKTTKKKTLLNQTDGLIANYIDDLIIYHDSVFINTYEGITVLPVDFESTNNHPPLISISEIKVNEKITSASALKDLNPAQNTLNFQFKTINQKARGNYNYFFKLEGLDSSWQVQSSKMNYCRYPSVAPGSYTFLLKTQNEDGFESELIKIPILIKKPYYQKWWFFLLLILLIVSCISILFILRIKTINRRNETVSDKRLIEKELAKSQLSALKSQMNPHFIFNALNSIQDYIIHNNKEVASDYLGLFSDLMRKYLNLSQKDHISLEEEIETLRMYLSLEKVRFEESLEVTILYDKEVDLSTRFLPTMLIQPFVENAIKHGLLHKSGKRILKVSIEFFEMHFAVSIYDNGIGRKKSAEIKKNRHSAHESFATSALQQRINLINESGEFQIKFKYSDLDNPTGTEVVLLISQSPQSKNEKR